MNRIAVILAGGLGTRLKGVLGELPKPMAPVGGVPFLTFILDQLLVYSFSHAVIAAGYRHEAISSYFGERYRNLELRYSVEDEPLGTGGALLQAAAEISASHFFVFNGDTLFRIDIDRFEEFHLASGSGLSVALRSMEKFDRYGNVKVDGSTIVSFDEKKYCQKGLINGGIYITGREWLQSNAPGKKFSFEKDILENKVKNGLITGYISGGYFIDIGIPEDYERAKKDLMI